jgi:hypothetical protein
VVKEVLVLETHVNNEPLYLNPVFRLSEIADLKLLVLVVFLAFPMPLSANEVNIIPLRTALSSTILVILLIVLN